MTSTERRLLCSALLLAPLAVAAPTFAEDLRGVQVLPDLVVVATRHPREAGEVVGTVSVIEAEALQRRLALDLRDLVREEPGLSVDSGGTRFGFGGFRIRGIGGNRVVTLIDGVPVPQRFAVGSYADSGRDYIDLGLVRRVEILRGPASTLYGSQAIGGVVSIQTLDPWALASAQGEDPGYGMAIGHKGDRALYRVGGHAAIVGTHQGLLIAGGYSDAAERHPAGLGAETPRDPRDEQRQSFLAKHVLQAGSGTFRTSLDVDHTQRDTELRAVLGSGRFSNTTRMLARDEQSRYRGSVQYEHQPTRHARIATRAYRQRAELTQLTDETRDAAQPPVFQRRRFDYRDDVLGFGADLQLELRQGPLRHRLGLGAEWVETRLDQRRDAVQTNLETGDESNVLLGERFPLRDFPLTRTVETGLYVHDELRFADWPLSLVPGLRYDRQRLRSRRDAVLDNGSPDAEITDLDSSEWTPRIGALWQASPGMQIFAQYAQGFRAPPASDVNLAFDVAQLNYRALPNPDLRAEHSEGFELGTRLALPEARLSLALFDTRYRDFIQSRAPLGMDPDSGTLLFQSINIERARIYGAELRYLQGLGVFGGALDDWSVELGAEWLRGTDRTRGVPLNTVDPPRAILAMGWDPAGRPWALRSVSTFVQRQTRTDQTRNAVFEPGGYAIHDLTAEYRLRRSWTLRAGIFNLFDRRYHDWGETGARPVNDPLLPLLRGSERHLSVTVHAHFR
jgi:hemoglobin/transferrin/lactoferrin receptor protein